VVSSILACLFVAQPALGQTGKPMSAAKMTCEDFVAVDDIYRPSSTGSPASIVA
jgi:acid stress chaperone HdeA